MSDLDTVPVTSAADEEFRAELRSWLAENLTPDFLALQGAGGPADDSHWAKRLEWERKLAAGRWLNVSWPREYGGRGGAVAQETIFHLEHARAQAPYWVGVHGWDLFGPTLMEFGSSELKARFLPKIAAAEQFWGQGFSEPNAGSDLASLRTKAWLDGDEWVIDGQKIWMTFGAYADWLYVLCRTDPDAPVRQGISMLLVPADQPGVDIRPIKNMAGGNEFCEVFFDGARTAKDLVVGEPGQGWSIVTATLGNERGGTTILPFQASFDREMDALLGYVRRTGKVGDRVLRARIAKAYEGLQVMHYMSARMMAEAAKTGHPGPESSVSKMYWSRWHQQFGELMMDALGAEGMIVGPGWTPNLMQSSFLNARAETIYGGADQVQHNIVAEQVLRLPREPR